jgi:hypothetical protein
MDIMKETKVIRLFIHTSLYFLLSLTSSVSCANHITFRGAVVEIVRSAQAECINAAMKRGVNSVCHSKTGAGISVSVKNKMIEHKGKATKARFITLQYF